MFKILANFIREQKTSLLQVFGLGFVIIIMVSSFLSLNFATTYINDQYWNDIAKQEFHQEINFYSSIKFKEEPFADSWLNNFNYMEYVNKKKPKNNEVKINEEKLKKATFQIKKHDDYNEEQNLYVYTFVLEDDGSDIHVGQTFAKETGHNTVDFKLSIPFNYPSVEKHNEFLKSQADLINNYVFDEKHQENKRLYFLTNKMSLDYYNEKILSKDSSLRKYQQEDIINQAKIYQYLITGMLYGDNIAWERWFSLNDYLITGKSISFVQTTTEDKVLTPILVKSTKESFNPLDLKDDEVLIYQAFAKENNLVVGQDFLFSGYKFKIKGFATSALAANNAYYFQSSTSSSNNKNQTVAWVNQNTMEKIFSNPYTQVMEDNFMVFNPEIGSKTIAPSINNYWLYDYFHKKLLDDGSVSKEKLFFAVKNAVHNRLFQNPINAREVYKVQASEIVVWLQLNNLKSTFLQISSVFLGLIFVVVAVIIFIVIFKMIDRNKRLIGILKANGYPNWKLNVSLVISVIFPIILFAFFGAAFAVIFGHFIVSTYSTAIILVNYGWPFYYVIALLVIFIPFVFLTIISFIMVTFLLRINALTLISNNWSKNKYSNFSITALFTFLTTKITQNYNFYNKLAFTTTFRSFGKLVFVIFISIFASTLLLFSFSSGGLVNNMFGLQFSLINYKYNIKYDFNKKIQNNFINNEELLYKKENVENIRLRPSLYGPLLQAIEEIINETNNYTDELNQKLFDFRYGYIMGSELLRLRRLVIEPALETGKLPDEFQKFWEKNIYFIDYLTNDNGQKETDLMINFGLLPFDQDSENAYTEINLNDAHDFNINTIDTSQYYYDNNSDTLMGDWTKFKGTPRIAQGINKYVSKFINPMLKNSKLDDFANLNLENMINDKKWLNSNFVSIRNSIIDKFNIENPDSSSVKIIPMIGSVLPGFENRGSGDGDNLGKTILYRYTGLDSQLKYIIGVIYDGSKNLTQNTVLMPKLWLNQAIFSNKDKNLSDSFANSKFTLFNNSELYQYLPIISENNDYLIDLAKVIDSNYLKEKGILPGLTMIYDVKAIKDILQTRQYSLQILILLFGTFSIILSFFIIIIISNINIRDNLVLINILSSLGYSSSKISYIFLIVTLPALIIFSLFSLFITPFLTATVAQVISNFLLINISPVISWWYIALSMAIVIFIYLLSFLLIWKLNVSHKNLMELTK